MEMIWRLMVFLSLLFCAPLVWSEDSDVTKLMKEMQLIPDALDEGPKDFLKVTYENDIVADRGVLLTPTLVKNQPKVEWHAEDDGFYALMLINPDAPSREDHSLRCYRHWLVGNIPSSDVDKGEILSEYAGAGPPKDSGMHRYIFLLYKQPGKLEFDEERQTKTIIAGRDGFSAVKFAEKYGLGAPLAGNCFIAEWDETAEEMRKAMGL